MQSTNPAVKNEVVESADKKVVKRAQWESFSFSLEAPGIVRATNESHGEGSDHSYLVNVETDIPVACECKAFEYQEGPCKHMVAVAICEPVLMAAQAELVADGGKDMETCQNGQTGCCGPDGDNLPCFECYRKKNSQNLY